MNPENSGDELNIRGAGAVKLVEDDDFSAQPEHSLDILMIHTRWSSFKKTGNPVLALEAIAWALQVGVYPPTEALRWLADGIGRWHAAQGEKSLDWTLGLTVGRGQTPHFKRLLLDERDEMLMLDMERLTYLGATNEEAAAMVASKTGLSDWNKTPYDMADLNAETLIALHASYKRKNRYLKELVDLSSVLRDPAWIAQWLGTFDPLYLPTKFKSML